MTISYLNTCSTCLQGNPEGLFASLELPSIIFHPSLESRLKLGERSTNAESMSRGCCLCALLPQLNFTNKCTGRLSEFEEPTSRPTCQDIYVISTSARHSLETAVKFQLGGFHINYSINYKTLPF